MAVLLIVLFVLIGTGVSCYWVALQNWPWYGKAVGMVGAVALGGVLGVFLLMLALSSGWENQR
jgi:hypothetical protein